MQQPTIQTHLEIQMLRIFQRLEAGDHELEHGLEVFRRGGGDEYVGVAEGHGAGKTQADGGGLAAATGGC